MNSPISTKAVSGSTCYSSSTPKNVRKFFWAETNEGSPKLCGFSERTEVFGWDESPEPLRLDCKLVASYARKRLDSAESPKSSKSKKVRVAKVTTKTLPPPELNNDLSAINDLASKVLSRNSSAPPDIAPLLQDDLAESLIACTQQVENIVSKDKDITVSNGVTIPEEVVRSVPDVDRRPLASRNVPPTAFTVRSNEKGQNHPFRQVGGSLPLKGNKITSSYKNSSRNSCLATETNTRSTSNSPISLTSTNQSSNSTLLTSNSLSSSNKCDRLQLPVTCNKTQVGNISTKMVHPCKMSSDSSSETLPDNSFEQVLQSFREEEDDWLTQVEIAEGKKTPGKSKGGFVRSKSFNQVESPGRGTFRRTSSFQHAETSEPHPLKKQKSFHADEPPPAIAKQCSLADIERKRLEAKFRRQFREIEKKRLEAQRRRNEKMAALAKNANETVKR